MKMILFTGLTLFILMGCSRQDENNDNDRRIKLNAGVSAITTPISKAAITTGAFNATIAGWESTGTPDYTQTPTWISSPTEITIGSNKTLVLSDDPQYNADNSIKTYIAGWFPAGTPANGEVAITSPDADVDVMYASIISGSLDSKINQALVFNHQLTQFKFVIIGNGWDTSNKLQSIAIDNAQLPQSLNVSTGVVTYGAAASFTIPGITEQAIPTTATTVGAAVMVAPVTGKTVPLTITMSNGTYNINATTTDTNYNAGTAYTVTLTFNDRVIGVTATITPWLDGSASGTIVQ